MTIVHRHPARELLSLREAMDRLFEDSFVRGNRNGDPCVACLPMDAYSTDNDIVVMASVPGLKPEDVEITIEGDTLTIRGEIPARLEDVDHIFAERFHGLFSRTVKLNVPVDVDKIEATFEDGVLTLVLPKAEEVKPKVIKVQSK